MFFDHFVPDKGGFFFETFKMPQSSRSLGMFLSKDDTIKSY